MQWKDGSTSWEKLKDLKASNPVEVAEYAAANRLVDEPAFKWWVPHTMQKQNRIISKVKSRYWRTTHKFGIRLPHSVEEALRIDAETKTDYWRCALNKEMSRVKIAWKARNNVSPTEVQQGKVQDRLDIRRLGVMSCLM